MLMLGLFMMMVWVTGGWSCGYGGPRLGGTFILSSF